MALINCNECGEKMSDKAVACPHCGNPDLNVLEVEQELPVNKEPIVEHRTVNNGNKSVKALLIQKWWIFALIIVVIIGAIVVQSSINNSRNAELSELAEAQANAYRNFITSSTRDINDHLGSHNNQMVMASRDIFLIFDQAWINTTTSYANKIRQFAYDILMYDINIIPFEYLDAHEYLLLGADALIRAMDYLIYGIDNIDAPALERTGALITASSDYFSRFNDLVPGLIY